MKNTIGLFVLIVSTSVSAQANFFPLLCRGGYLVKQNSGGAHQFTMEFKAASIPAGETGANLGVGECAFKDRALFNNEPRRVMIQTLESMGCSLRSQDIGCDITSVEERRRQMDMIQACALDQRCVLDVNVANIRGDFRVGNLFSIGHR